MYKIDLNNATINDVIVRSITCHPTLLIGHLLRVAIIHEKAAHEMHDAEARKSAFKMRDDCLSVRVLIRSRQVESVEEMTFGERMACFTQARKLQLIDHATAAAITGRE